MNHRVSRILPFITKPSYYLSICCIIKDENSYLKEWMEYYIKIGVEHFFLYDNESVEPVQLALKRLGLAKYATITVIKGISRQQDAYDHCLWRYGFKSRWIAFVDMDEFIVPKVTKGNLPLFLKDFEAYGGLGINWLVFGSGGIKEKSERPQLETFIWRSGENFDVNNHIKSIVQPKYARRSMNPHAFFYRRGYFCVNENFKRLTNEISPLSVNKIQVNHYYCRSLDEYQEKIKRGRADSDTIKRKMDDFYYHDGPSNAIMDTSICDILKKIDSKSSVNDR
ncbi:hypothetical protein CKK33_03855 [Mucilaginibacter sp. MD40]|uniref:glycosyltransferase family 92 protein n=1 Tax=Mucilaginibacter sp. MD40 TaxID=2029590 RepID=UPI000BACB77B|nr:glycosyltransferase family 92 protein [Mucilaginibacter sp. MD40]PAW92674.1 hypothetical protein CKK33_03855 [Mucilaginibacter sp. MD40]